MIAGNTVRSATLTPAKFQMGGNALHGLCAGGRVQRGDGDQRPLRAVPAVAAGHPGRLAAGRGRSRRLYNALVLLPDARPVARVGVQRLSERDPGKSYGEGETGRGRRGFGGREPVDRESVRGDGRDASVSTAFGVAPQAPGTWVFAPPPSAQSAQTPWLANGRRFVLDTPDQFRAPAPPAITSPEYATDLNETEKMGSATSTARTAAQTATALFWNANVINQYNQVYRDVATSHNFDLVDTVRLMAMGNMVAADAGIACMDSKYHYLYWRPITAIRGAGLDDNAGTTADPAWSPPITTPNHPEYPSAHGCVTAAVTGVLTSVLKTSDINIDVPAATGGRHDPDHLPALRDRPGPAQERRRRSSLGRSPLPLLDHRRRQPRHPGRPVRPEGQLPADEEVTDPDQAAAATAAALSNTSSPSRASTSAGTWVGAWPPSKPVSDLVAAGVVVDDGLLAGRAGTSHD